jgi:hypothetical protein
MIRALLRCASHPFFVAQIAFLCVFFFASLRLCGEDLEQAREKE